MSEALKKHEEWQGKIEVISRVEVKDAKDLSLAYTPGVAEPCVEINKDKSLQYKYTRKHNMVAVITDGSAVLGLGNIGGAAGMPVMEGKCVLFKKFADVDAFPLCISTQDTKEIIDTVANIADSFGGINLEDISAPRCFEIERELKKKLDIPVFHDDQHGTAVVTLAGLTNALKIVGKRFEDIKIAILGSGGVEEALSGADVLIGVSGPNTVSVDMIKKMNNDAIVFAMSNPVPEISRDDAIKGGARIVGTGRSDYPNQINNVLAFPGIFRGAFDAKATEITENMKLAAVKAIASLVSDSELNEEYIIPRAFDERVGKAVAKAVAEQAVADGVIRK